MAAISCGTRTQKAVGRLGLIIMLRNPPEWETAPEAERALWDLHDPDVRARLEAVLTGKIYKAYGSKGAVLEEWAFFCLSELPDLQAWGDAQRRLEGSAESGHLEWDVFVFGRRAL